jgi:alkane 1-monooxygenase
MKLLDLRFGLALLLPIFGILGILTNPQDSVFFTIAVIGFFALMEMVLPNRSPQAYPEHRAYFTWLLRLYVPLQMLLIVVGMYVAAQSSWFVVAGLAISVGYITGAQGITFAHELGHSKSKLDRFCGWALMTSVSYGHFMVEHYRGHHPRAATYDDPASARYGETLYQFLPRTLAGSFRSAWTLEKQRIVQMKSSYSRSPLVWSTVVSAAIGVLPLLVAVFATIWPSAGVNISLFAIKIVAFFAIQSIVAVLLLEMVNYIEHYGLSRKVEGGKREPFGHMHAWNADHPLTNSILANLQRHSDHHMHAWKPYSTLEPAYNAPQLPTGYAGSIWLATVPPLWFAIMHPRLEKLKLQSA